MRVRYKHSRSRLKRTSVASGRLPLRFRTMSNALPSSDPPDIEFASSSMDVDEAAPAASASLKRAASLNFEDLPHDRRKRLRGFEGSDDFDDGAASDQDDDGVQNPIVLDGAQPEKHNNSTAHGDCHATDGGGAVSFEEELALELNCGCCTEICYNVSEVGRSGLELITVLRSPAGPRCALSPLVLREVSICLTRSLCSRR